MFWNHLLRRVFATLGGFLPQGLDAAGRIFAEAHHLGLLDLAGLDEPALTILALALPPKDPLRAAAETAVRGLPGPRSTGHDLLFRLTSSARADERLLVYQRGLSSQRGPAADSLQRAHGPRVRAFLAQLYLTDLERQREPAIEAVVFQLGRFAGPTPPNVPFTCALYRHVLDSLPAPLPVSLPAAPPDWWTPLPEAYHRYLASCRRHLNLADRVAVDLSLHAGLTLEQVRCVRSAQSRFAPEDVTEQLEAAFRAALRGM